MEEEITFIGGVTRNIGMIEALKKGLGAKRFAYSLLE
jgi:hypothetical protein